MYKCQHNESISKDFFCHTCFFRNNRLRMSRSLTTQPEHNVVSSNDIKDRASFLRPFLCQKEKYDSDNRLKSNPHKIVETCVNLVDVNSENALPGSFHYFS